MDKLDSLIEKIIGYGAEFGKSLITALLIYFIGKYIIKLINKIVQKALSKRDIDPAVKSFTASLVNITLIIVLLIAVIGALGIETTSFAALLASAGVAIGMALSGNLQNFASGLLILVFRPYKVGDYIDASGISGTVKAIQIFHTVLLSVDNKTIIIPNNVIGSSTIVNYSTESLRRVDFSFAVAYGTEYSVVKAEVQRVIDADSRIKKTPASFIELGEFAASSVNFTVRVWCDSSSYWDVFFDMNKNIYEAFNRAGIEFPFPQVTVSQAK